MSKKVPIIAGLDRNNPKDACGSKPPPSHPSGPPSAPSRGWGAAAQAGSPGEPPMGGGARLFSGSAPRRATTCAGLVVVGGRAGPEQIIRGGLVREEGQSLLAREPPGGQQSVLLQNEVLQFVRRAEEEGCGFPVAGDQLPHRADLRGAELGGWHPPVCAVRRGRGGAGGAAFHAEVSRACGQRASGGSGGATPMQATPL